MKLILIVSGLAVGWFFPDLEALVTAFWTEREHHVSAMLRSYYKERRFKLLQYYWVTNRGEYQSLIIHSAFFQLVLVVFSFYMVSSGGSVLASFLCLAFLGRLFWEQYCDYKKGTLKSWFWAINIPLTKNFFRVYFGLLGLVFVFLVFLSF